MPRPGRHQGVYAIGVTKNLTGLTERQIRYYEAAQLLQPVRTPGNQRLYSPADIEQLLRIKILVGRGLTLDDVRQALADRAGKNNNWLLQMRNGAQYRPRRRQRPIRLRDLPSLRVLARYHHQHPPTVDRLYRGGMGSAVITLRQGLRLYPPSYPLLASRCPGHDGVDQP